MAVRIEYADGTAPTAEMLLEVPADGMTAYTCSIHNETRAELLNLRYEISGNMPYTVEGCPDTLAAGAVARGITITISGADVLAALPDIQQPRCYASYDMLYTVQ